MSHISDLVKDAKLSTKLDLEFTTHTFLESSLVAGQRPRRREREEKWTRKRHLGMGIFGMVWLEEYMIDKDAKLRVVKEVRRVAPGPKPIDYSRELEAIVKFSQQKFDGCFVKSSGWFETDDSFFICTEYFMLGDLQKYIYEPFPEGEAQHITLQLLEGLDFMHSNGFAHCDLRPKNILVRSKDPEWWVKIGDFGINKRVMEGLTGLKTFNAAPTFTAPELYKEIWEPSSATHDSSSKFNPEVDIWSLGVISYYLLAGKLPFYTQHNLLAYYNKESTLPMEWLYTLQSSDEAVQFLKDTLAPSPSDRITAGDALNHDWLSGLPSSPVEPGEPQPLPSEKSILPLQPRRPNSSQDVMLPGTINLTSPPTMLGPGMPLTLPQSQRASYRTSLSENSQQGTISEHQHHHHMMLTATQPNGDHLPMQSNMGSLGTDDMYKPTTNPSMTHGLSALHLLSNVHPLHRPATEPASIEKSQCRESQIGESSLRPTPLRQLPQLSTPDMSIVESVSDTLPPYTRRRSDAAPIPISDLDFIPPRTESPSDSRSRSSTVESARDSIERRSSDRRFSDRFRRASESMMPKRHNHRSVDHGKKKDKDKLNEISPPISRSSSTTTRDSETKKASGKKAKSQVVQIPGRPQFAEGLPLFPVRVKKT
ncbi:uncharacterized protein N7483_003691 [Penicillium malachiteum]|uniref:uncharacterized protein n=1 Tax=Penicillium malachiteum TaxID=1324776 RepID=UPI00254930EF|nr:uncharacterized protein N7483_003691 [Penicillium malachiteum]KAJ5729183.1 hypothetical protein N7483_003691 [Penicillium malachiteum]